MNPLIDFADMIPRGRGRGRDNTSYRGGRGRGRYSSNSSNYYDGKILATIGDKKLIASNISGLSEIQSQDLELFNEWKIIHKKGNNPSSSEVKPYINAFKGQGKIESPYIENGKKQIIMLLNKSDKQWENTPWTIYDRYIMDKGYPMEVYKSRLYYEIILSENGCEFRHYHISSNTSKGYAYSKILIQKIISMDEWGLTPYKEKTAMYNKNTLQYNYFDYIEAFNKVFYYQNDQKTHTWLIKIYPEILDHPLPSWVMKWWQFYGTSEEILPKLFIDYYEQWCKVIPDTPDQKMTGYTQLWFFIEFSIPYIWKSEPITGYTQDRIFCLKRKSLTRFWDKMLYEDPETKVLNSAYTINLLKEKIDYYSQQAQIKEQARLEKLANTPIAELDLQHMTKEEIVKHNMKYLINILRSREDEDEKKSRQSDGDISMASNSHNNNDDVFTILQDSQELEDSEDIIEEIKKIEEEIRQNEESRQLDEMARRFIEGSSNSSKNEGSSNPTNNDSSRKGKGKA